MDLVVAGGVALASAAAGLAVYKGASAPFADEARKSATARSLSQASAKAGIGSRLASALGSLFPATRAASADWSVKLARAGVAADASIWHGAAIASVVCGAAAGGFLSSGLGLGAAVAVLGAAVGAAAGWMAPRLVLSAMTKRRKRELLVSLPSAIELLRITTAAGLQLERGFKEVADQAENVGAVAEEFAIVRRETGLLGVDFPDALRNMSNRCQVPEVSAFCAAVAQARKQGASVSGVLKSQGDMARSVYFDRVKEKINKIAVWIAVPLGLFFLPCAFVLLIAPMVADIMGFFNSLM